MNTKRFVLGSFAVFVFFFLYEWLVHGVILAGWYQEGLNLLRPESQMSAFAAWMILGHLILAFGFCLVFLKGYEGKGVSEGVRYGIYVAFAFGISTYLVNYAVFPHPGPWVLAWIIGTIVQMMVGGAIIAAIYKPKPAMA